MNRDAISSIIQLLPTCCFLEAVYTVAMGDCSVGDFLLVFLLLAILHNGLSDDVEVTVHRTDECLQLYSKPTGDKGDTLIIGSQSKYESVRDVFPDYDIEKCVQMDSVKYQRDLNKYGTKIFKRSNSEHFDVPVTEQLQEVEATDYFIKVGVQAVICSRKKYKTEGFKRYEKIVNSMSSIQDNIREIKYYSGVSVSIEECGGRKCIHVTETKCIAEAEGEGLVQFKCDYDSQDTQRPAKPPQIVPNQRDTPIHWRRQHTEGMHGYKYGREGEETMTVSGEGESFRIGINENPSGIIVSKTSTTPPQQVIKVACQPPIILNTTIFHPECYQKVKNEGDTSFKDVLLDDTQFRKKFTVVDETVQICKEMMENGLPDSSPYARVLYRVQMTVIGKTKVNQIMHGTGITELYLISLSEDAVTVRYTDVRFYDAITRTSVDNVIYKYVFPIQMVSIVFNSAPAAQRSLDVEYKLWPEGMIYSTFISGEGYNLQVGSKPKLSINIWGASCERVDYSSDHFKTELKIVADISERLYAHSTENIDYFSRPIQQQSWRCRYTYFKKTRYFIRVVNHLEILVPVHTLESYDGVEILRRPSGEIYKLEIFEVKYLLENQNKPEEHLAPMRANGRIVINSATDTAYVMGQGFNAISKSEVHPRFISQIPKRAHNRNDYYRAGTINDHKTLQIDGDGRDEMRFITKFMEQDEGKDGNKKQNRGRNGKKKQDRGRDGKKKQDKGRDGKKEANKPSTGTDGVQEVKKPFTGLLVCYAWNRQSHYEPYFEIFRDEQTSGNNKNNKELNKQYFGNRIPQEMWDCFKDGDTTSVQYFRIETKTNIIIKSAKHALKAIQFTPVDDVRLKLLESTGSSDNSKYNITYEGVRYYRNIGENGQIELINIDFGGYFIFESTPSSNRDWRSGTINIKKAPSTSKEIVHKDETTQVYYSDSDGNRGREYSFHLPGDQTSKEWQEKRMMRIGESNRVQQKIRQTQGTSLKCCEKKEIAETAVSEMRLQTLVQTFKYSSQGNAAELEQQYHAGDTRVWECTDGQIKILRVMNNFVFNPTDLENIRTILYSDGIAIFGGGFKPNAFPEKNDVRKLEIAEVKFLNAMDYTNLKYEGALEFDSSSRDVGLHPIHLRKPEIQDVNYILNDNEFFKTTFPVDGDTLEIGEPHPGIKSKTSDYKKGKRFQDTMRCDFLPEEKSEKKYPGLRSKVIDKFMRQSKVILLQQGGEKKDPSTITDLKLYFDDIKQTIWSCLMTALGSYYFRVQTQMKLKPNKKIQHIFHQNGVKIFEDYKDHKHLIEITSYFLGTKYLDEDPSAFVPIKFEGLVIFDSKDLKKKFMNDEQTFQNHLDKPILQFSALSRETGVTYLVESQFHSTIDNSDGKIVTCVKYEDKNIRQADKGMQTKILVNEGSTDSHKGAWQEVDHTSADHILYESYETWSCNYQENDFTRVVNKMIMKDNARIYYPDGVEVQRLILLDGKKFMQIKHVRFFRNDDKNHAFKYIGRLQLERQTLPGLEKMLSSSPFNIQVMGQVDEREEQSPLPYHPSYIFTLDSMRYAAFLNLGERSDGHDQSPPIKFGNTPLQTTFLNANSSRIFQLGRSWDKELYYPATIKCYVYSTANLRFMKYIISPEVGKTKYNPRVAEYIDQKLYILTQDEFDEIFNITSVRTWFCASKDVEFLKVETVFETTAIPLAVRYTEGSEGKLLKVKNEYLLRIKETFYTDVMNSKVYKRPQNHPVPGQTQEDLLEFVIKPGTPMRRFRQACLGFLNGLIPCL